MKVGEPVRIMSKQKMVATEIRADRFKCTLAVDTATFGKGLTTAREAELSKTIPRFLA